MSLSSPSTHKEVPPESGERKASVAFILVTLLLDTLGIGLIVPVLPRLIGSMAGNDPAHASQFYGLFIASYACMQFLFAPIIGGISDRFGRRSVLLLSLLGAALDHALMAVAPGLGWLFVGRVISGITGANFSTATAYIADITPPEKRAQSFGMVGAAFGLGFIFGPALGGLAGSYNLRAPFVVAASLNLLNFLYGLLVLPESLPPEKRREFSWRRSNPLGAILRLRENRTILRYTGVLVCSFMAQHILQSTWALYGQYRFQWTERDVGASLTCVGVMSALVQGGLLRKLLPIFGERTAIRLGFLLSATGMVAFGLANKSWMMFVIMVPFSFGGMAGPATQSLLSREVSASEQGQLQGTVSSLQSLCAIAGPLLATNLFAYFNSTQAFWHLPGAPWFAAALFHTLALIIASWIFRSDRAVGAVKTTAA